MDARIRAAREARRWSQQELAERAGVSRQLVGAVEAGRQVPNVAAALGLARALGTTVEDLFASGAAPVVPALGRPTRPGTPLLAATVGAAVVTVPVAHGVADPERWGLPDAVATEAGLSWLPEGRPEGVVVAGCDPILGMLAALLERTTPHRLVCAHASTGASIEALAAGRVHGVVVHAPDGDLPAPPVPVRRWHLARWQVGLAASGRAAPPSVGELAERRLRVVQRDPGAGSQRALERALAAVGAPTMLPGPVGDGHLDVARRLAQGRSRVGITMEAAAVAFDLGFAPLEAHAVELWLDERWASLPGAVALVEVLTGASFRSRASVLAYDVAGCGADAAAGTGAPR